jgi:molecular chaperone GrpE
MSQQHENITEQTENQETLENIAPEGNEENAAATGTVSPEAQLEELRRQLDESTDKYLRLYAEFDNFKKRTVREKLDWMKTAAQDTMSVLLPVLDDFDRARKFATDKEAKSWSEGVELVYHKLFTVLKQKGLEPMNTTGEPFDPELHEAITEIPAPAEDLKGKVVDTIEKGYRLNDKIIRHAKVVVGK